MTLSKALYQGDAFRIIFPSYFDISSSALSVYSGLLSTGTSYEGSGWDENKVKSDSYLGDMADSGNLYRFYQVFSHKFEVDDQTLLIYSFANNMDPRSGLANDMYVVFQINNVVNPSAKYSKNSLTFSMNTVRYTYNGGSELIYDESTVNFADDLATGTVSSAKCDFSNSASYGTYINNKMVPSDLNIFVDFDFTLEHKLQAGGKIVIVLDGMAQASGTGVTSWIYVSKGLTASGSYVSAAWDSTDTIVLSGY